MPHFSAFTPFGMLRFSGAPSSGASVYQALARLQGGAFNLSAGTDTGAKTYATAMMLGYAADTLRRAKEQRNPLLAGDMISSLEANFDIVPSPTATLDQRRQAVALAMKRPAGGRASDIVAALTALLGSDFVAYRPISTTERVIVPSDPATQGIFSRANSVPRVYRTTTPVTKLGVPFTVGCAALPGVSPLMVGEKIVAGCENQGLREVVTVASVGATTITATFAKSHDLGAVFSAGPFPAWSSSKRSSLVVVTAAIVKDPVKRQQIHNLMRRYARGVSTWSIVSELSPGAGATSAFTVGVTALGTAPLGNITYH